MEHAVTKSYDDIHNTFTVLCEMSKMFFFASSIMKNIVVFKFTFWPRFRFPVKLICCIVFGSTSSSFCLLKSIIVSFYSIY